MHINHPGFISYVYLVFLFLCPNALCPGRFPCLLSNTSLEFYVLFKNSYSLVFLFHNIFFLFWKQVFWKCFGSILRFQKFLRNAPDYQASCGVTFSCWFIYVFLFNTTCFSQESVLRFWWTVHWENEADWRSGSMRQCPHWLPLPSVHAGTLAIISCQATGGFNQHSNTFTISQG